MFRNRIIAGAIARRCYSQTKQTGTATATSANASAASSPNVSNVKGLSNNCVKSINEPVGPGASPTGTYKVPEYFCFNRFSYSEAEVEMAKYRCPQPSAVQK